MTKIDQTNLHLLLPWKVAGVSSMWAKDLGISHLDAMMRFYATDFYRLLEDESTKLWSNSPQQLYVLFRKLAPQSVLTTTTNHQEKTDE